MNRFHISGLIAVAALAVAFLGNEFGAFAQVKTPPAQPKADKAESDQPKSPRRKLDAELRTFMRAKLNASSKILEGLAMEDFDVLLEGATEMNRMSNAEKWRQHDDVLYRQFSTEFRQSTADLIDAAKKGLLDRAALKWMNATMTCIECHRYVRNQLVVDNGLSGLKTPTP